MVARKRRGRGEGSIYRRKDGRYVGQYEANGKRRYVYGATRAEVSKRLTAAIVGRDHRLRLREPLPGGLPRHVAQLRSRHGEGEHLGPARDKREGPPKTRAPVQARQAARATGAVVVPAKARRGAVSRLGPQVRAGTGERWACRSGS
jgi:hypothetical protein